MSVGVNGNQKYSNLIREHLVIAAELVEAAKVGNRKGVADAERRWFGNGEEIAEFLSRINPFISRDEFQDMFFEHLDLTTEEALFILQNKLEPSIAVFDKIEEEALHMADILTNAIVEQLPRKFQDKDC